MKSPRDKGFYFYKDGSPMPVEDLIEALRVAISRMSIVVNFDVLINKNKQLITDYKRKLEVLEKIKESYVLAKAMSAKPKMKPVKRRGK